MKLIPKIHFYFDAKIMRDDSIGLKCFLSTLFICIFVVYKFQFLDFFSLCTHTYTHTRAQVKLSFSYKNVFAQFFFFVISFPKHSFFRSLLFHFISTIYTHGGDHIFFTIIQFTNALFSTCNHYSIEIYS